MVIAEGDKLPQSTLVQKIDGAPVDVPLGEKLDGRRVIIFGLPGAFTPTCDSAHLPSFMRTADQFAAKGIDEIICIAVNDIHVMHLWGEQSGGTAAGITFLADGDGSFTKAIDMSFSVPKIGFINRSKRYAMVVEDGVVTVFSPEIGTGVCELSTGEFILGQI